MPPIHIPILRQGVVYKSLDTIEVVNPSDGNIAAIVSQANSGLIRKDINTIDDAGKALRSYSCQALLEISKKAGELFLNGTLPIFDGEPVQSPEDYMKSLAATSGLPFVLIKRNMEKIYTVFMEMGSIISGLTRGLPLEVIDSGVGVQSDIPVSYYPAANALGLVLPSNSPGVNSLWMPAFALKVPVIIKPGREEPWTPSRIISAFIAAGAPREAFSFYPANHEGASSVIDGADRVLVFGGEDTVNQYSGDSTVSVHGPGWSKVVIGDDCVDNYKDYIDLICESVAINSGRSCINASAVLSSKHGEAIAMAMAQKLAKITPCDIDAPDAALASFANANMAAFIDQTIEVGLQAKGARDLTAEIRGSSNRLIKLNNRTFVLPTVIWCDSPHHPLFNKEFLFPYVSVTETKESQFLDTMGSSLVVSLVSENKSLISDFVASPVIDRLNIGAIPTNKVNWDQPHEGNLFEFLYKRRAIQRVAI